MSSEQSNIKLSLKVKASHDGKTEVLDKIQKRINQLKSHQNLQERILERVTSNLVEFNHQKSRISSANEKFGFSDSILDTNSWYKSSGFQNYLSPQPEWGKYLKEKNLKYLRNMNDSLIDGICDLSLEFLTDATLSYIKDFEGQNPIHLILTRQMDERTYNGYLEGRLPVFKFDFSKYGEVNNIYIGDTRNSSVEKLNTFEREEKENDLSLIDRLKLSYSNLRF